MGFNMLIDEIKKLAEVYGVPVDEDDVILSFRNYADFEKIGMYGTLSEDFIREFMDCLDMYMISITQNLSESFIREFINSLNPYYLSVHQTLSEDIIIDFKDKFKMHNVVKYQTLLEDFIKENNLIIPDTCWLYKDIEFKRQAVLNTKIYEIEDDYIVAYKSIRQDGYSVASSKYFYEVGKTYHSRCDYNTDNLYSFGLSAWTETGASKYYDKGRIMKVRIHLNDLGCIVQDRHNLRCKKLEILEEV